MLQESVFNSPIGSLVAPLSDPRDSWNDPSKMHKQASVESSLFVAPEFLKGIAEASTMSLGARSCAPFMRRKGLQRTVPLLFETFEPREEGPKLGVCVGGCTHTHKHAGAPVIHPKSDGHGLLNRICTSLEWGIQ